MGKLFEEFENLSIDPSTGLTGKPKGRLSEELDALVFKGPVHSPLSEPLKFVGSLTEGTSKYDTNLTLKDLENIERERALKQPIGAKAFNAVVGGVASGILTAVQDFGYILDFENNINRLKGLEYAEENWLTSAMKEGKQGLERGLPIYRLEKDQVFDWSDPGFYFSSLKGILDSAVGFAIPGMAASKGISAIQKMARTSKYLEFLKTSKATAQTINSLASGYITNFAEGKMMAVEQFENSMNLMKDNLTKEIFEDYKQRNPDLPADQLFQLASQETERQLKEGKLKEFESLAGEEANNFMNRNKVFMLTDAIGLHGLHKGQGFTRSLLKEKGVGAWAKRFGEFSSDNLLLQAGKEGLEEISQNVLQMEGEYQAAKKAGQDVSDTPDNLAERVYQFATSDKALLEGMMGLFGGGPQRILTEAVSGNYGAKSRQQYQEQYDKQQSQINANTEFLNKKLGDYAKAQILRAEAISKGLDNTEEVIKKSQFLQIATENFARGTTENLERQLQDIVNGVTEEERIANGWDENYQQQAQEQLAELKRLERNYNKYTRYENQASVFQNRETRRILERDRQLIKSELDDITTELELQEDGQKDPELVKQKEYLEKQLNLADTYIKEQDDKYNNMTSPEAQQAIRKQKKELEKKAQKAGNDLRNRKKKENQDRAAAERKAKNEKKQKVSKKDDEKIVDTDTTKKTKDDLDTSVLSDEDTGPSVKDVQDAFEAAGPDVKQMSADEAVDQEKKISSKNTFDQMSDELFSDMESNLTPEAIISGEGLSPEQRRLGILQNMVESIKDIKGTQKPTFDDLIELLIDRHGKKRIAPVFNMLQGLWVQTHPDHKFSANFAEYLQLNADESKELQNSKKEAEIINNEQYLGQDNITADEAVNDIQNQIANSNSERQLLEPEYLRVEQGSGIIAYLSRLYQQTKNLFFLERKDIDNVLNQEMQDKGILDPDKYPVGTKVTLIVEDNDDLQVYVDPITKSRTTWGAKKDNWKTKKVEGETDRYLELFEEEVPIGVYVNGKKIGYLHEVSWINPTSVYGDIQKDKERSRKIRKHIVANREYTTTISGRTTGYLFRSNKGPVTTTEALQDETLPIVVAKNGALYTSRNETFTGELLNNKGFKEGLTYVIIPIGNKRLALPLLHKKLSESPTTAKTIRRAVEIFMTEDNSEEAQAFANEIYTTTGLNIMNNLGISQFVNMFVNITNTGQASNLKDYLLKYSSDEQRHDGFLATFVRDNNDLQFEVSNGKGIGFVTVSKASLKDLTKEKRDLIFETIEKRINDMYTHVSLDSIGDSTKKVVIMNSDGTSQTVSYKNYVRSMTKSAFLGQNIAEEGQPPKYIYTIQPVITMDFNEITENVDKETGKAIIPQEEDKIQIKDNVQEKDILQQEETPEYDEDYVGGMSFDEDFNESLMPESIIPLTSEEVENVEELSEATIEGGDEIKGVIISDFKSVTKQNQVTDYIRSKVVDRVFRSKRVSRNKVFKETKSEFEANLKKLKNNLKLATEANDIPRIERYTKAIAEIEIIISNWAKLERLVIKQMKRIDNIKVQEANDEITEEEEEAINETSHFSEASAFTTPPTDRLSPQVKQFLSGIGKWKEDQNNKGTFIPDKNYFGAQKVMDFWDVYNILQRITPNLKPTYEDVVAAMKQHQEAFPFLKEVLIKLENAPQQLRNQFVVAMTNHYVDMKFIMFGRTESGAYELVEHQSDSNAIQRVIISDWHNKLIERSGRINPDGDDAIIDKGKANSLVATWERWNKTGKYTQDELAEWLYEVGIEVTDLTWKDMMNGEFVYLGKKQTVDNLVKNSLFKIIAKNLATREDKSLIVGDTLVEENVVKTLAKHDAQYRTTSYSNSHKSGIKTVYSFSLNKFLVNRVRELKEGTLVKNLMKLAFNGESSWATGLAEENSAFAANFSHWTVSLEAIKKKGTKSKGNRELHNLSEAEIELVKIGMLQRNKSDLSGGNNRIINILYPTASDKTTAMGLTVVAQELKLDRDGNILPESIEKLTDLLVRPEIQRIKVFQIKKEKGTLPNIKGYDQGAEQFLMFPEINNISWKDKDGNLQNMFNGDGSLNGDVDSAEAMTAIRAAVKAHFDSLVEEKLNTWTINGIGITSQKGGAFQYLHHAFLNGTSLKNAPAGHNPISQVNLNSKVKAAAVDMTFQYLIANAEIHKLFTGDPALYYKQAEVNKGKKKSDPTYNYVADAKETYDNINKRLAADIAPGMELAEATTNYYNQAILADSPSASLVRFEITDILDGKEKGNMLREEWKKYESGEITEKQFLSKTKGLISSKYYSFDGTDAQEYTTWQEHLYVMKQLGDISDEEYNEAYFALSMGKELSKKLLGTVMQPMKPVYVDNQIDETAGVERRIYIKSSSFPLIPQLVKGMELDNLRIAMENQKIDRAAFSTAVKIGGIKSPLSIWEADGRIKKADQISFVGSVMNLNRKGFRIQQRVPYDAEKATINKVTQASKNLFVNMLGIKGFSVPWYKNGESVTGKELQDVYHQTYERLHQIEREKLLAEIGHDPATGKIGDISKLRALLIQESRERNYPLSDQELIELDRELRFLAFSPSANKYESLLNSLITSRIIRLKLPGKSFVLGSQEGFKGIITDSKKAAAEIAKTEGIVFTENWTGELLPARVGPNGERLASQAIVPWKFKTKEGKTVDIKQYIKNNRIDFDKVPQEVLNLFGMRIPNQGPNSQGWIEVVGFLPEASGDLIIATRDFVVQMGSDFDVDKLYTYMYGYYFDNEGNIKIHREIKKTNESDVLKNQIIDIHLAIHKNPHADVQAQIVNPLGTWELSNIATEISNIRRDRESLEDAENQKPTFFTGLSDEFQRKKFKDGTAGKSGVGVFSLDSMFNAMAQGKGLVFMVDQKSRLNIQIGDKVSDGDLSAERALDKKTYKSDIIAGYQSAAVDNAKEPILDKLNINTHTFKAIKILNQLGFGEEVPYLIAQDILVDYVAELERLGGSLAEFTRDKQMAAYEKVINMPKYKAEGYDAETHSSLAGKDATINKLKEYMKLGDKAPNYKYAQRAILDLFRTLDGYGKEIQSLQSTLNPDSRGVGKSVLESILKEKQIYNLFNTGGVHISNATKLVGDMRVITPVEVDEYKSKGFVIRYKNNSIYAIKPETINGHAIVYGLFTGNDLWSQLFPYDTTVMTTLFERIEGLIKGSNNMISQQADRRKDIWNNFKSFIFSGRNLGLFDSNITAERNRLLYDKWETVKEKDQNGFTVEKTIKVKESLGSFVLKLQNTPFGKNNPLISKLTVDVKRTGEPTLIKFNASAAENIDESNIYSAFVDLITRVDENGVSPIAGEFNGSPITLREFAQELVLYSYITGGIQEAIQFVKYIPASYLTTVPFAEQLGNTRFLESEFGIQIHENPILNYYTIPPFVEQFIQHNPDQVPQVELEDMYEANSKSNTTLVSFKLKETLLQRIGHPVKVADGIQELYPAYVSVKADKTNKGYKLYKYDLNTSTYYQIDTLGSFGNDEYNSDVPTQISLVKNNKSNPVVKSAPAKTEAPTNTGNPLGDVVDDDQVSSDMIIDQVPQTVTGTIDLLVEGTMSANKRTDGKEAVKELLNEIISTTADPYIGYLADEILGSIDQLPNSLVVDYTNRVRMSTGAYFSLVESRYGDKPHTLVLNTSALKGQTREEVMNTILHELLHGLTAYKIYYYQFTKTNDGKGLTRLLEASPELTLTEHERAVIKSLEILFNQAKEKVLSDPAAKIAYKAFQTKLQQRGEGNDITFTADEVNKFYGFTNLAEFVAVALTSPEFAQILNNIQTPSGKTFMQSLKERLLRLIQAITGFKVEKGSVLEQTIYDVLDLINMQKTATTEQGINISSYESGLGKDLSNFAHLPITFRGKNYASSEAAYQDQKKSLPDLSDENVYKLMVEILSDKLTQHPYLFDEIWNRGGMDFLDKSTHNLIKQGNIVKEDRWTGQNGLFMRALKEAFGLVQFDKSVDTGNENGDKVEDKKIETKQFVEYGTYYKFNLKNGKLLEGFYSQGNPNNWKPMNPKGLLETYQRLENSTKKKEIEPKTTLSKNQLELQDGRIITFNSEQYDALESMRTWMENPNDLFFTLTGYAGTGKTSIVRKLIEENNESGARIIGGSAPTHRAKRVLTVLTGNEAKTLHSMLGLSLNTDLEKFNLKNLVFDPQNPPILGNYDLVIIDEASMINKSLYDYTITLAKKTGTKIIFMGDPGQIPPVGEVASKVFTDETIKNKAHLSKVERTTDSNPLNSIYDAIRSDLNSSVDKFAHETQVNERGEGIIFTSNVKEFGSRAIEIFTSEEYANDPNTAKIIAWTNDRVKEFNLAIRRRLIGENVDIVEVNDILMGYQTLEEDRDKIFIENSGDYKVIEKSERTQNKHGIYGYYVTLVDVSDLNEHGSETGYKKRTLEKRGFIVDSKDKENFENYSKRAVELINYARKQPLKSQSRKAAFAAYYKFRRENVSFEEVRYTNDQGQSDIAMNKSIDYGYAITAHKSQGGTYKHVFVDEDNIDKNKTIKERNQIKYVALSRASHTATVLSFKTKNEKNTFVKPAKQSVSTSEGKVVGDVDVSMFTDKDIEAFDGGPFGASDIPLPEQIVSDNTVEEFMKHCKGI